MSILHSTIDKVSQQINFNDSENSNAKMNAPMNFEDIKNGIYSIILAGISSGLNDIEEPQTPNAKQALITAQDAALSKSQEVLPDILCDKIQSQLTAYFDNRRTKIYQKDTKKQSSSNLSTFATNSAELFANKSVNGLRSAMYGDTSISEALDIAMKETASDVSSTVVNATTSKISEKLGADFIDTSTVIKTAKNVKECFLEYINGTINGTQFFMKIGYDGLYKTAHAWGTAVGTNLAVSAGLHGAASALTIAASSTLVIAVYGELYNYAMEVFQKEIESEERMQNICKLSSEAIAVIRKERENLLTNTFIATEHRQEVFHESLNDLSAALETGNIELLTIALNKITEEVGGIIQFKTFEEFDDFMQDDSLTLTF